MGDRPELYWSAAIGHVCHVGITDIGEMTPQQLLGCADLVDAVTNG